ncbi:MAG: Spy/CpxP family protein refolding chaperone [Hyphomicrobiales bacterium]|nr:Spy/CpxP family protein refolding chaperone [Hyphomicrobiales bacterium]MBV8823759.1 Spy/CpxP family protein refolding chaperone [Hyphomicrobiales bacterium]
MAKTFARLGMLLATACCAGTGPALAQPRGGVGVVAPAPHVSAPAPHISAPAVPHISAPVVPHVSAPVPHVAVTPHFNVGARINAAPQIAAPRFSARTPSVHQFTQRGHSFAPRSFARQTVHGPALTRRNFGRVVGRSVTRGASRTMAGRNMARHATRTTGRLDRSGERERALARGDARAGAAGRLAHEGNRIIEPNNRERVAEPNARNRPNGTQLAAVSRPLGERNRNDNDRHRWFRERRRFHHGGVVGWFGPVFWPTAYDDVFDYVFWPGEYDDYGFWAYAYDDVLAGAFFAPETEDIYPGDGYVVRGGRGRAASRRRTREATVGAGGSSDICRVDPGLTQWPVEEIAQVVEPTPDQQRLLDDVKAASSRAAQLLQTACPTRPPSTPLGRLDAMSKRLDAMLQALDVVRPALAKFYDSLSDEQKARFNEMGRQQSANQGVPNEKNEARVCGGQGPGILSDQAIARIERDVRPNDQQKADLDALRDASAKAADGLRDACPSQTPITPVARLDAMAKRIQAMRDAINTVRPALAKFYDSLTDEQKAHFNIMARNQ